MFVIRQYRPGDLQKVMELHIAAMRYVGAYKGDGPWDEDLHNIAGVYLQHNGEFLVGELNHMIIAMGAFKKGQDGLAEIKRMRVEPGYQRCGYGRMILEKLEERARKLGYLGFKLETSEIQIGAQKLYKQCGFKEVGREEIDNFNCILFEKRFV